MGRRRLCSYLSSVILVARKRPTRRACFYHKSHGDSDSPSYLRVIATFVLRSNRRFAHAKLTVEALATGPLSWIALGLFLSPAAIRATPVTCLLPMRWRVQHPSALIMPQQCDRRSLLVAHKGHLQHSQTLIRCSPRGAATSLFAATIGSLKTTSRESGVPTGRIWLRVHGLWVGAFVIGIFHVLTHAFSGP